MAGMISYRNEWWEKLEDDRLGAPVCLPGAAQDSLEWLLLLESTWPMMIKKGILKKDDAARHLKRLERSISELEKHIEIAFLKHK